MYHLQPNADNSITKTLCERISELLQNRLADTSKKRKLSSDSERIPVESANKKKRKKNRSKVNSDPTQSKISSDHTNSPALLISAERTLIEQEDSTSSDSSTVDPVVSSEFPSTPFSSLGPASQSIYDISGILSH